MSLEKEDKNKKSNADQDNKQNEDKRVKFKNKDDLKKDTSSKLKSFAIEVVEGIILLLIIYFTVVQRLIPQEGPPYEAPVLRDYLLALLFGLLIIFGYYTLKRIVKSKLNKRK